jgi:hypothetical protein
VISRNNKKKKKKGPDHGPTESAKISQAKTRNLKSEHCFDYAAREPTQGVVVLLHACFTPFQKLPDYPLIEALVFEFFAELFSV